MSDFKGRHFEGEIVLWAVRWYCRYGVGTVKLPTVEFAAAAAVG